MEQNINNKIELRDKLISFFNTNKVKIYTLIIIFIIIVITAIFLKINNDKKTSFIAEQYINTTLEVLNKLQVVSAKRMDSTRRKLKLAVSKHIVNDGELTAEGQPVVNHLEFWGEE